MKYMLISLLFVSCSSNTNISTDCGQTISEKENKIISFLENNRDNIDCDYALRLCSFYSGNFRYYIHSDGNLIFIR